MTFSGLPEPKPEEEAAKDFARQREYEREQKQKTPPKPYKKPEYTYPPGAKRTVDLLKKEIVPRVDCQDADAAVLIADILQRLDKLGVTHRYYTSIPGAEQPADRPPPLGERKIKELKLKDVPLFDLMRYFGDLTYSGWVVYPDGSITWVDNQCGCGFPKDGCAGHTDSYASGLSNMAD